MPSEQRLHPVSILFALGGTLKALALPALLLLFGSTRSSPQPGRFPPGPQDSWEIWALVLLIPAVAVALARYYSFRLRYDESEIVVHTGLVFRNVRHIPYARIQNLGAVRNVFHRLLGVIEVRIETGAGNEPEATIRVLPLSALDEMRRRVFESRVTQAAPDAVGAGVDAAVTPAAAAAHESGRSSARTLLALPLRELMLEGILDNRGMLVIGALFGLLWEFGLVESLADRLFGDASYGRGLLRDIATGLAAGRFPLARMLAALAAAGAAIVVLQLASIGWTTVRLYGFRLSRIGEDLRTEFGLLTKVSTTIPLQRIQTVTVQEGPLQRLASRVSVRVETAGGVAGGGAATQEREAIAPILRRSALPDLLREIVPELDLALVGWQPVHPGAFRRAVKGAVAASIVMSAAVALWAAWGGAVALVVTLPLTIWSTRMYVRHLGWAADEQVVIFRSGWLWRRMTIARTSKIQAVMAAQSPFDRRTGMGSVRVDTAGSSERSHRVDVPYLPWDVALSLRQQLAARAASTVFRW